MRRILYMIIVIMGIVTLTTCSRENERQNTIYNAVTDVDGNTYDAVRIGKQVWMKTNLRTKHFRDGSEIPNGLPDLNHTLTSRIKPYFYEVENVNGYDKKSVGLFYNWPAVIDNRKLCPSGWHVPSDAEWAELTEYIAKKESKYVTKAMSSPFGWAKNDWKGSPGCEPEKNNKTCFSALPVTLPNYRNAYCKYEVCIWSSTERGASNAMALYYWHGDRDVGETYKNRERCVSVRCIKD